MPEEEKEKNDQGVNDDVEDVDTPDDDEEQELEELMEKAKRADELEKELEKYREKDFNFSKFRKMKKEEQEKMLKTFNEKERALVEEVSDIRSKYEQAEQDRIDTVKKNFFDNYGLDEDLQKEMEQALQRSNAYLGEPKGVDDYHNRLQAAYQIVKSSKESVNPINRFTPTASHHDTPRRKKYTETQEGQKNINQWFPNLAKKDDAKKA